MSNGSPIPGSICLVTIHGMGFQQAPDAQHPEGYADLLHEHLSHALRDAPDLLSDDPHRTAVRNGQTGKFGAIYVQSHYPTVEGGLRRLGTWRTEEREGEGQVDPHGDQAWLVEDGKRIAHIALVYSHPENRALQHVGAAAETLAKAVASSPNYGSPWDIARMLLADARAGGGAAEVPAAPISLKPRGDQQRRFTWPWQHPAEGPAGPPGALGVLRALEEDVSTYVCRNDLRENVRGFAREALLRLCCRPDVQSIVVNAHSQGTTVAFDVLRTLPPFVARKIRCLLTSGSPLRKYATLFTWGTEVGSIELVDKWLNFWDARDLVADPLRPREWRPGAGEEPSTAVPGLFEVVDESGQPRPSPLEDIQVFNVNHTPAGGYPPHNYWDNQVDWIPVVARLLRDVAAMPRPAPRRRTASRSLLTP